MNMDIFWKVNGTNGTSESREEKKMELKNRVLLWIHFASL